MIIPYNTGYVEMFNLFKSGIQFGTKRIYDGDDKESCKFSDYSSQVSPEALLF